MQITAPTNCPSCSSDLEWVGDLIYCRNSDCAVVSASKVEHFAKTLKVKGLGPAAISKLNLTNIIDVYELSLEDIAEGLSSSKLAGKLYEEIQNSKSATLEQVLPAFSIPLIGKTASTKLCKVLDSLDNLTELVCKQAGLGPKATSNLMAWFEEDYPLISSLPFSFSAGEIPDAAAPAGVVCISGKLVSVKTKADAEKLLNEAGYLVKSSLTKDVTILLNESGQESAKTKKARDTGISIITNLNELVGV